MLAKLGLCVFSLALPVAAQTVQLVSQSTAGVQGNGDSRAPRISADGEWVVFKSDASTLVPGDTNGVGDIFLRHLGSGTTTLISVGVGGALANGESFSPALSADGSVIAFQSAATNLVPGDTNGKADVFVWEAGMVSRVSVGTSDAQAGGASDKPSVSGDGRYVAFESVATNLVVGDTNGASDIFRFDRVTGSVVRASVSSSGAEANGASLAPWLDADGSVVTFDSTATNLVGGDTNGSSDVFVRDLPGGTTLSATVFPGFVGNGNSDAASISADGQFVAFRSDASNLIGGDSNGLGDVFLADPWNQQLWRVSEGTGGIQGNGASNFPQLSPDGLFVAFASSASSLITGDTNARDDVFVHDIAAAKTNRISSNAYGVPGNGHSRAPSVANGGASTAFKSDASNLLAGDTNAIGDVFVRRPAAMTWYVDASAASSGAGSATSPFRELQSALAAGVANSGDTVLLSPGVYFGGFDTLSRSLTLRGTAGSAQTALDGQQLQTVLIADQAPSGTTELEGLEIRNGLATLVDPSSWETEGGGVHVRGGSLSITECRFSGCVAENGGGLWTADSVVTISDSVFVGNDAVYEGGGARIRGGQCTASGSTFESNQSSGGKYLAGVGLRIEADHATVNACTFKYNVGLSFTSGVGLSVIGDETSIAHSTFDGNWSQGSGDGAGAQLQGARARIEDCTFASNSSNGALQISGDDFSVIGSNFIGNVGGENNGAGMLVWSVGGRVAGCRFEDNAAEWSGSAIFTSGGPLDVRDSEFLWNSAGYYGGGGGAVLGNADFTRCVFAHNATANWGSSVHDGNGVYVQCTFVDNIPRPESSFVGGLPSQFDSCVITGNGSLPIGTASAEWTIADFPLGGMTNLLGDPKLWDPENLNFRLEPSSPCIDSGNPSLPLDADGSRADMGAIPFDPDYCGTPRVYCTAKVNSVGCAPTIAWTGTPSLVGANDDFHITASNVLNNKNGLLFWGTQDFGAPFQGGTLCVKPPIVRTGVQNSDGNPPPNDCSGSYEFHLTQAYMQQSLFQVGTTIYAQYWSRDPGFSAPNNVGLTDALRLVVCP